MQAPREGVKKRRGIALGCTISGTTSSTRVFAGADRLIPLISPKLPTRQRSTAAARRAACAAGKAAGPSEGCAQRSDAQLKRSAIKANSVTGGQSATTSASLIGCPILQNSIQEPKEAIHISELTVSPSNSQRYNSARNEGCANVEVALLLRWSMN